MKEYPSMRQASKLTEDLKLHTWGKIDGSNLRFEWNKKRGWYKAGTRTHLFDETDKTFGEAIGIFNRLFSENLTRIAVNEKWEEVVVFLEFWGKNSFAGMHQKDDPKTLTLFDVNVHKKGILPPEQFLKLFGNFVILSSSPHLVPDYLGEIVWDNEFIRRVRNSELEGMSFEGVVGKAVYKNQVVMYKSKSLAWINKVYEIHGEKGKMIVES